MTQPKVEQHVYMPKDRASILDNGAARTFRKTARLIAVQQDKPFLVYTDHGPIAGEAGDWLATNHPDDDPTSDIWPVSKERMLSSYEDYTE